MRGIEIENAEFRHTESPHIALKLQHLTDGTWPDAAAPSNMTPLPPRYTSSPPSWLREICVFTTTELCLAGPPLSASAAAATAAASSSDHTCVRTAEPAGLWSHARPTSSSVVYATP